MSDNVSMSISPLLPTLPYYVSSAKVAFLCKNQPEGDPVRKVSNTFKVSLSPGYERKIETGYPAAGGRSEPSLEQAVGALIPRLVGATDPSLMARDWFELDSDCLFGQLQRDAKSDGGTVATWFAEVINPELEQGMWFFLTGSPGNLIEEWLPDGPVNRSGSRTESAYDLLASATRDDVPHDSVPHDPQLMMGFSGMRNMLLGQHHMRTIAMAHRVVTDRSGCYMTSNVKGGATFPVVRAVIGTPIFVEKVA